MKAFGGRKLKTKPQVATARLATSIPTFQVTIHTGAADHHRPDATDLAQVDDKSKSEARYVPNAQLPPPTFFEGPAPEEPSLPLLDALEDAPGAIPAYETTTPSAEKAAKTRQVRSVAHI
jgi:hypothetical protein